ncbi:Cyclic nucleotide-gated cation channel alpha-3 [Taenia solium]|eukprot:TsM_000446900 transcript=TsM_000446900 gene=TsM_000446900
MYILKSKFANWTLARKASRRRLFGENDLNCLGHLPEKLKTELALHVHLETLKKVTIFHECRPEFLHDLVLKMRPYIFTPGDLICRKGEVAREMFIIADGVLEVIGKAGIVLKRLEAGDFFGEIGILCINGGGNKRTADVRAVGYAELFVLSREDVLSALADHPDAHTIIMEHATQRLMESKSREDAQITVNQRPTDIALSGT